MMKLLPESNSIADVGLQAIGWKEYIQQPVLPASLAFVLLYFNVVLAPGSIMTAFLTQRGHNLSSFTSPALSNNSSVFRFSQINASHFRYLAMLSLLSVVSAAWMFCREVFLLLTLNLNP